jgi:large subunit ribosomal protein L24e
LKPEKSNQKLQRECILKVPKCVYCGKTYEFPRGLTYITKDGNVKYLCSSKCKKNMKMKRRKVEWVRKSARAKEALKK